MPPTMAELVRRRRAVGLTMRRAAELSGVSSYRLARAEAGIKPLDDADVNKLLAAFRLRQIQRSRQRVES
jgi:predicted transcriptional regulator